MKSPEQLSRKVTQSLPPDGQARRYLLFSAAALVPLFVAAACEEGSGSNKDTQDNPDKGLTREQLEAQETAANKTVAAFVTNVGRRLENVAKIMDGNIPQALGGLQPPDKDVLDPSKGFDGISMKYTTYDPRYKTDRVVSFTTYFTGNEFTSLEIKEEYPQAEGPLHDHPYKLTIETTKVGERAGWNVTTTRVGEPDGEKRTTLVGMERSRINDPQFRAEIIGFTKPLIDQYLPKIN